MIVMMIKYGIMYKCSHRKWAIKFNDFSMTNLYFPYKLRNAENQLTFWVKVLFNDKKNFSSFQTA